MMRDAASWEKIEFEVDRYGRQDPHCGPPEEPTIQTTNPLKQIWNFMKKKFSKFKPDENHVASMMAPITEEEKEELLGE